MTNQDGLTINFKYDKLLQNFLREEALMAYANKIVVSIVFFLVAGFFFLSKPETSFAVLGCCINNGINCSGCSTGPCQQEESACQGANQAFTAGEQCFDPPPPGQNIAFCGPGPSPQDEGCCQTSANACATTTQANCSAAFFPNVTSCPASGLCEPPIAIPTLSQWGMIIMAGFLGLIGIFFITRKFALKRSS